MQGLITSGSSLNVSLLQNYTTSRLMPYLIFFGFGIISIIGIFTYCTSCCCPCCCCKKTSEGNMCRFFSIGIVGATGITNIAICIVGLTYAV